MTEELEKIREKHLIVKDFSCPEAFTDWLIKKVTEAICEWCRCLIIYVTQTKEEGNIVMGIKSRYEYLKEILLRYKYATRAQKKNILDEFCTNCGYNRKYAIRLLNSNKIET